MDLVVIGYLGLGIMLLLVFLGIPIAYALAFVALGGMLFTMDLHSTLTQIMLVAWEQGCSFSLMSIPLFILMGTLAKTTGIVADLFDSIRKLIGRVPGGLCVAGVLAAAGFGAVTGSTMASVATMGSTVMPELEKYKYDDKLSSGAIAASGGLAALIPPSVLVIVYCVLTDQSIGTMFIACVIPGLLVTGVFCLYILLRCLFNPQLGPVGPSYSLKEKIASLKGIMPITLLFVLVVGGMYGGIVTPTEAASLGVAGVILITVCLRRLSFVAVRDGLYEAAKLSTAIFLIIVGGWMMSRFLVTTGTTEHLVNLFVGFGFSKYTLIASLFVMYLILGCALEPTAMLILTMPLLFPIVVAYGIDPIWFGGFITMMMVLGGMTPPVGLNVYVLQSVCPRLSTSLIFKGVMPFVGLHCLCVLIIVIFPELVTWLPSTTL